MLHSAIGATLVMALVPGHGSGGQEIPSADELVAAWEGLDEAGRRDTVEWYVAECDNARHFRAGLERFVLQGYPGARRFEWPAATADLPLYDTKVHTPAQLIPRKFVAVDGRRNAKEEKRLVGTRKERGFRAAFTYDWTRGTVVTVGAWDDPERIAFNAARGVSPYHDLVEAIVEMEIDAGEVRDEARAFGHAYSDRQGNAFPRITLYDAWSSGAKLEMPDVECLGILHDIEDDWRSFVAPVPERMQRPLYDRIGKHYAKLRKYRALRTAIARTYLAAEPNLPAGYGPSVLRLHGFWELQTSEPAKMADDLPTVEGWGAWFEERAAQADDDLEIVERSRARMASLQASRDWSRRTFYGILKEYGAFDPKPPGGGPGDGASGDGASGDGASGDGGR